MALITDGRFRSYSWYVSPEAAEGGNRLISGDEVVVIFKCTLDLLVGKTALEERRKHLKPFKSKISSGWLRR